MPPEGTLGLDEVADSEFLPADAGDLSEGDEPITGLEGTPDAGEETAEQTLEETSQLEETPETAPEPETPATPPSPSIDADALEARIVDKVTTNLEKGLNLIYGRLKQSNRDTVRSEVSKAIRAQVAVLDDQLHKGRISEEAHAEAVRELKGSIEDKTDEVMSRIRNPQGDDTIRLTSPTRPDAHPQQQSFTEAALALYHESGLSPNDPESIELSRLQFRGDLSLGQALAAYQKAIRAALTKKAQRVQSATKGKTPVPMGGGKTPVTQDALLTELNSLLRQSGGDYDVRRKREARIEQLSSALDRMK